MLYPGLIVKVKNKKKHTQNRISRKLLKPDWFHFDEVADCKNVLKAHGDLVSAVDFSEEFLVTGYEDSNVAVWSMETGLQVSSGSINHPFRPQSQVQEMPGHNGGVTGIQIQLNLVATSSYDSTVSAGCFL